MNPENSIVDQNTRYTRTNSCILVNPENSIVDHNTRFSGISERDLNVGPTKSLKVKFFIIGGSLAGFFKKYQAAG